MPGDAGMGAREIAADALDQLLDANAPLEAVIRKALRVAALRRHPYWRAWLQLQFIDLSRTPDDAGTIETVLETASMDDRMSPEVASRAYSDYRKSRQTSDGEFDGASITVIEQVVQMAACLIREGDNVGPMIVERVRRNNEILAEVKNRIRQYLASIDDEEASGDALF
jgi:hypothetical protein